MTRLLFKCISYLIFLFLATQAFAQSKVVKAPALIINEVDYSDYRNDAYFIELLVVTKESLLLEKDEDIILDDAVEIGTGGNKYMVEDGYISINPAYLKDANPGDLIVIHGSNFPHTKLKDVEYLEFSDSRIKKWEDFPNHENTSYDNARRVSNTSIKDHVSFSGTGDKFSIKIGKTYQNDLVLINDQYKYSLDLDNDQSYGNITPSPGTANSPLNAKFINTLKSNGLLLNCGLVDENSVEVTMNNGDAPYAITLEDSQSYQTQTQSIIIDNLTCGEHTINVVDVFGKVGECVVKVKFEDEVSINLCPGKDLVISDYLCYEEADQCLNIKVNETLVGVYYDINDVPPISIDDNSIITLVQTNGQGDIMLDLQINAQLVNVDDPCDDNDICTINDVIDNECNCVGEYIDADGDGLCSELDPDDDNPDDPCGEEFNYKVCRGDCIDVDLSFCYSDEKYDFEWSPQLFLDDPYSNSNFICPFASIQYKVKVIDPNSNQVIEEIKVSIETAKNKIEPPKVLSELIEECPPTFRLFTEEEQSYSWYFNDDFITTGPVLIATESGKYTCIEANDFGCENLATFDLQLTNSISELIVAGGDPNICTPPLTLEVGSPNNFIANNTSLFEFDWYRNGEEITGANKYQYNISESGTYSVNVTDEYNCSEYHIIEISSSIDELSISPENPGVCSGPIEIECVQDFDSYSWTAESGNIVSGADQKIVIVDEPGIYKLEVTQGNSGEPDCSKELEFEVIDLRILDPISIHEYLIASGFYYLPVNLSVISKPNKVTLKSLSSVESYTNLGASFYNDFSDVSELIESFFDEFPIFQGAGGGLVTDNDNICVKTFKEYESDLLAQSYGVWAHLWTDGSEDRIYLKGHYAGTGHLPANKEHESKLLDLSPSNIEGENTMPSKMYITLANLFMPFSFEDPDSGNKSGQSCGFPKELMFPQDRFFTPAGTPILYPENAYNLKWSSSRTNGKIFGPGALIGMTRDNVDYPGHFIYDDSSPSGAIFTGYYKKKSAGFIDDLEWQQNDQVYSFLPSEKDCTLQPGPSTIISNYNNGNLASSGGQSLPVISSIKDLGEVLYMGNFKPVKSCPDPIPEDILNGTYSGPANIFLTKGYTLFKIPPQGGKPIRYIAAVSTGEFDSDGSDLAYYEWFNECWIEVFELPAGPDFTVAGVLNEVAGVAHDVLDILGFIPVIGTFADGLNATIYAVQGDVLNAALSSAAIIFDGATISRVSSKVSKFVVKLKNTSKLKAPGRFIFRKVCGRGGSCALLELPLDKFSTKLELLVGKEGFAKVSKELLNDLNKSINGNRKLATALSENPDLIRSWNLVRKATTNNSVKRYSVDILEAVSRHIDDADFMKVVGGGNFNSGQEAFGDLIKKYVGKCDECGKAGSDFLPDDPGDYIDKVVALTKKYSSKNGKSIFTEAKGAFQSQDGAWHAMKHMDEFVPAGSVKKIDAKFEIDGGSCAGCRFDVEFGPNSALKYIEYKSYKNASQIPLGQFKSYLEGSSKLSQFEYIFNGAKLTEDAAKMGIQTFLKNSADDLFNTMGVTKMKELFNTASGITFKNATEFKTLLKNNATFRDHALSFVKIN